MALDRSRKSKTPGNCSVQGERFEKINSRVETKTIPGKKRKPRSLSAKFLIDFSR